MIQHCGACFAFSKQTMHGRQEQNDSITDVNLYLMAYSGGPKDYFSSHPTFKEAILFIVPD